MKRLLAVAALALSASGAAAQVPAERPAETAGAAAIRAVNNSASVSWLVSRLYYQEPNDGYATTPSGYLDAETGNINGPKFALSFMSRDNLYFHADWAWATGVIAYSGYFQGGPPYNPAVGRSRATVSEGGFKFGKGFELGRRAMLTPYLAAGRRYWVREVGHGTPGTFVESYSFLYFAFGAMAQFAPWERWVFTADGTIGRTIDPWINVPPAGLDHTALGPSILKKAALEADYRLHGPFHLFAGFDYEAFTFGESALQQVALEPFSKTEVYNLNAGARYSFGGSKASKSDSNWDMSF